MNLKATREEVYQKLAEFYKYTVTQIATMNPFQRMALLKVKETLHFETEEDYYAWLNQRN